MECMVRVHGPFFSREAQEKDRDVRELHIFWDLHGSRETTSFPDSLYKTREEIIGLGLPETLNPKP